MSDEGRGVDDRSGEEPFERVVPPRVLEMLLLWVLPADARGRSIAGDLREEFRMRHPRGGLRGAVWYGGELLDLVVAYGPERLVRVATRKRRIAPVTEGLWQDFRFAARTLWRSAGFTSLAVLTLALGIGATTAIFSVVDAVLLRPLPYADPDEIVLIWNRVESGSLARVPVAAPDYADYRTETTSFSDFAAVSWNWLAYGDEGDPEQVNIGVVTENLFRFLGVRPALGRDFGPADAVPLPPQQQADPSSIRSGVALLSETFWRARYAGDPGVVGRMVTIGGRRVEIVGVLPRDFALALPADASVPGDLDVWMPMEVDFAGGSRRLVFLTVLGRVRPDVTVAQAQAEMDALAARFRELHQPHRVAGVTIAVSPLISEVVSAVRPTLLALLAAVGMLLLVACANVANLLLVRATSRRGELALRRALGAGRMRLARLLMIESIVLASAAGALGIVLGTAGVRALLARAPAALPRTGEVGLDGRVLAFALTVSALAALIFGAAPALSRGVAGVADALRARSNDGGPAGRSRARAALVVAQVALTLVLLFGAGLVLRTFVHLTRVDPGFETDGRTTFRIALPFVAYPTPESRHTFFLELRRRLAALPGVQSAGLLRSLPFEATRPIWQTYRIDDEPDEMPSSVEATIQPVLPGAFEALGARLIEGRFLNEDDAREDRFVVVVDRTLARRWDASAVGRRVRLRLPGTAPIGDTTPLTDLEVVGVVDDVQIETLGHPGRATIYLPMRLYPNPLMGVIVHGPATSSLAPRIREVVASLDPGLPVTALRPLGEYLDDARAPLLFTLTLAGAFAMLALAVAMVGLFAVVSYVVRLRAREIGIRMAVGATRGRILGEVLRGAMMLVAAGAALGLLGAVWASRAIESMLVGVHRIDLLTAVATTALVGLIALAACMLPARRAARLQPAATLRAD